MINWGWYWKIKKKHMPRKICSTLPQIDSFKLYQNNKPTGFMVQPLEIKAEPGPDYLIITYRKRRNSSYVIPVDKLPCNYGGFRYFFKCPLCQQRMRILYFAEQSLFLCRKCLNLSYSSQRLRPSQRYIYMSEKVKSFIIKLGGDLYHKKPSRMHKRRYEELKGKHFYYEDKSHQALNKELREWYGVKADPYLDDFR